MARTMMDLINLKLQIEREQGHPLTKEQWTYIRNNGTTEEIEAAVEKMIAQGGYENLA